jgi:hypothetical protein
MMHTINPIEEEVLAAYVTGMANDGYDLFDISPNKDYSGETFGRIDFIESGPVEACTFRAQVQISVFSRTLNKAPLFRYVRALERVTNGLNVNTGTQATCYTNEGRKRYFREAAEDGYQYHVCTYTVTHVIDNIKQY